jgi:hypothetical protein|nr:MAG TPA: hypothetical protein [Caudoviricetes sp.]DAS72074.1 MAG TPA: hypothetical protein [Caudoviricetes sp.]
MKIECTVEEFKKLMKKETHGNEALKVRINNAEGFKKFLEKPETMEMLKSVLSNGSDDMKIKLGDSEIIRFKDNHLICSDRIIAFSPDGRPKIQIKTDGIKIQADKITISDDANIRQIEERS